MKTQEVEEFIFKCIENDIFEQQYTIGRNVYIQFGTNGINMDSLHYLKLIMLVEKNFEIHLDDCVYDHRYVRTVGDLICLILEKIYQKSGERCLVDIISEKLNEYSNKVILVDEKQKYTYLQIYNKVGLVSHKLMKEEIGKNEPVIIFLPNCIGFVVAFFALANRGCESILLDIKLTNELQNIIAENSVKYIISDEEHMDELAYVINQIDAKELKVFDINELLMVKDVVDKTEHRPNNNHLLRVQIRRQQNAVAMS